MHLVGFIIEIYYDARLYERQIRLRNYHFWFVITHKSAVLMYFAAEAGNLA